MATFLDVGFLEYFTPLFVFILVMVIVWALLEKIQFFPKNTPANLMIAFILGVLFILIPELNTIISLVTPWFVVLVIFLLIIILVFMFMGVKEDFIGTVFGGENPNLVVVWTVLVLCMVIFGYAFTQVYGEQVHNITAGENTNDNGDLVQNIGQIFFTPKVLGMFFLLGIAALVIRFVSASTM